MIYDQMLLEKETGTQDPRLVRVQDAATELQASTELALRDPSYIVHDKLGITPVDLNIEIPALDSALMLEYICRTLRQYARFEKPEHVITIALWIASTWLVEPSSDHGIINGHLMFEAFPRLMLIAEKGSGKNRVMKIVRNLARNPTVIGSGKVTSYGVARALEDGRTVFIDEFHHRIGVTGNKNSDLLEMALAYSRESGDIDGKSGKYNEYDNFGPMVLAAQPTIMSGMQGQAIGDLFERSFIIPMSKWEDEDDRIPALDDEFEAICKDLRDVMELWSAALYELIGSKSKRKLYKPVHTTPKNLTVRREEISLPLLTAADYAVSPEWITEHGNDTRWARLGRNAVQVVLLGHGDNARALMDGLRAKFGDAVLAETPE